MERKADVCFLYVCLIICQSVGLVGCKRRRRGGSALGCTFTRGIGCWIGTENKNNVYAGKQQKQNSEREECVCVVCAKRKYDGGSKSERGHLRTWWWW